MSHLPLARGARVAVALIAFWGSGCTMAQGAARAAQDDGPAHLESLAVWVTPPVETVNVERIIFMSEAAGTEVSAHLYLPDAYRTSPEMRFPVLFWLHGSGGGPVGIPALARQFHQAIRDEHIPPVIVVFPNGLPHGMWVDSVDGRQPVETILMDELIPHVDATYRTLGTAEGRLLEGFSMGGYGAARLGLSYPEKFSGVSMLGSGPLQLDFLAEGPLMNARMREVILDQVYGGSMSRFQEVSPWRLAEALSPRSTAGSELRLRLVVGAEDELLEMNRRFRNHLEELDIAHEYIEVEGVPHAPLRLIQAMGDEFWVFHREALGS